MSQTLRKIVGSGIILMLMFLSSSVIAAVGSVTAIPTQLSVSATGGTVSVTWRVVHTLSAPATVVTSSPTYTIKVNGVAVSTITKLFSRTTTPAVGVPETLTFSEVLPVSVALASQIAKSGNVATIERTFGDTDGAPVTGVARLNISGSAGVLSVRRIDLSFENGGKTNVVAQNSDLRAVAEVSYRAKGLLQAEWRLIDSASIRGGGFERRLSIVRQQLTSTGNGRIRLTSPRLPTGALGLHQVKLVVTSPTPSFTEPLVRYYVNPASTPSLSSILPLVTTRPLEGVTLAAATLFDWHPVDGAAVYQVELFKPAGGKNPVSSLNAAPLIVGPLDTQAQLITGKIVPGDQTSATFARFSRDHLTHGFTYLWRVRAIGPNGAVIGQSDLREILYP